MWTIRAKEYPMLRGDIFLLNNSEHRAIRTVFPPEPLVMEIVDFEPQLAWLNNGQLFDERLLRVFFQRDNSPYGNRLPRTSPASAEIHTVFDQLAAELLGANAYSMHMSIVKLLNMLVLLHRAYYPGQEGEEQPAGREWVPGSMQAVFHFIHEHFCDSISLEQLSELGRLHPSSVSRLFKRYSGLGLSDYIAKLRIKRAVRYLRETDKTVIEIALLCGFNNNSNFYKAFRRVTGRTPGSFRSPE
ncbi:AraC family transcriptional regulator [Paenibacillus sp. YN15]|uniref:helix-turn-helix transcriptional regulator n=1 Tax=Paenibacillus sp. YN15 TaxID=1742774 RepID=UPI0015EB31BC|nr:AraC family transcriptional regulator [Paenibacillus sp. YN15]